MHEALLAGENAPRSGDEAVGDTRGWESRQRRDQPQWSSSTCGAE
ncbi:MAG: hypothetical protein AVDCRST_MAG60-708 [uncultured Nocardioides sp.]|uniref:Uncharacterized protein n=1 Tax=uncultured Nocardioides sp. TaxID=198441 RepID=A0A6J4N9R1_9ACTN|nr:MAG: hypothetical protein AVDCRST_MAG60-708 [uncultured Nocardioides sp.]